MMKVLFFIILELSFFYIIFLILIAANNIRCNNYGKASLKET